MALLLHFSLTLVSLAIAQNGAKAVAVKKGVLFSESWGKEQDADLAAFSRWADNAVNSGKKTDAQGVVLAKQRRAALVQMIKSDPAAVIAAAVPSRVRGQLPAQVVAQLETPVSGTGDLSILGALHAIGGPPVEPMRRSVTLNGQIYRASVYGRRKGQTSKQGIPLHGVVVDGILALHEGALREIETGETPAAGKPMVDLRTPAEKAVTPTPPILAEMGGKIYGFASREQLQQAELRIAKVEARIERVPIQSAETLLQSGAQLRTDAAIPLPPPAGPIGNKNILVIRVDFSDLPGNPAGYTAAATQSFMDGTVSPYFLRTSYGKASMTNTVTTQLYRMPQTANYYATGGDAATYGLSDQLHADAQNAAAANYTLANYGGIIVLFSGLGGISDSHITYGGLGEVPGTRVWVNGEVDFRVVVHELGHTYGLNHANSWQVTDGNPSSATGTSLEYGDIYDAMGGNGANDTHTDYNPYYKNLLGWITNAQVQTVTASGIYRISRFDNSTGTGTLALKITKDASHTYWVGIRRNGVLSSTTTINSGAYVIWGDNSVSDLLDMTTPANTANDAALALNTSFTDFDPYIAIRPLTNGGNAPDEYMDVEVGLPPSPVWVDFSFGGLPKNGTFNNPYTTLAEGVFHVSVGGIINLKGSHSSPETITIGTSMILQAIGGSVTIGQ